MRQRSCRNSKTSFFLATKSLGTGAPKRADLSRTKGFVPTFLTKEAISLKLSDELKELACFVSKIHSRRGSTQSFPLVSKSFFASNARTKVPRREGSEGFCKVIPSSLLKSAELQPGAFYFTSLFTDTIK